MILTANVNSFDLVKTFFFLGCECGFWTKKEKEDLCLCRCDFSVFVARVSLHFSFVFHYYLDDLLVPWNLEVKVGNKFGGFVYRAKDFGRTIVV